MADNKAPVIITTDLTSRLSVDSRGNKFIEPSATTRIIRDLLYSELPMAEIRDAQDKFLCHVPLETKAAFEKKPTLVEALSGKTVVTSPFGVLPNLCKKSGPQK